MDSALDWQSLQINGLVTGFQFVSKIDPAAWWQFLIAHSYMWDQWPFLMGKKFSFSVIVGNPGVPEYAGLIVHDLLLVNIVTLPIFSTSSSQSALRELFMSDMADRTQMIGNYFPTVYLFKCVCTSSKIIQERRPTPLLTLFGYSHTFSALAFLSNNCSAFFSILFFLKPILFKSVILLAICELPLASPPLLLFVNLFSLWCYITFLLDRIAKVLVIPLTSIHFHPPFYYVSSSPQSLFRLKSGRNWHSQQPFLFTALSSFSQSHIGWLLHSVFFPFQRKSCLWVAWFSTVTCLLLSFKPGQQGHVLTGMHMQGPTFP